MSRLYLDSSYVAVIAIFFLSLGSVISTPARTSQLRYFDHADTADVRNLRQPRSVVSPEVSTSTYKSWTLGPDCPKKHSIENETVEEYHGSGHSPSQEITSKNGVAPKVHDSSSLLGKGRDIYESRSRRSVASTIDEVDDSEESLEFLKSSILPEHYDDPDQGFIVKRAVRNYELDDDEGDDDVSPQILEGDIPTVKPRGVKPTFDQIYKKAAFISLRDIGNLAWFGLPDKNGKYN